MSGKNLSIIYNTMLKELDSSSSSSSSEDESGANAERVPKYSCHLEEIATIEDDIAILELKVKENDFTGYESDTGGSGTE